MNIVGCFMTLLLIFIPMGKALALSAGQESPEFGAMTLNGASISSKDHPGKVLVVVYWRTDQERSLLALKDIGQIVSGLENKTVQVITVIADDDDRDQAKRITTENNIKFPVALDPDRKIYSAFEIRIYPTTLIIDQDGKLAFAIPSHPPNYRKLVNGHIRNALGELDDAGMEKSISTEKIPEDKASAEMNRLYNLALKFDKSGMFDMAISTAAKAISAKPESSKAQILLGFLHLKNDDADSAIAVFENALKIDPTSHDAMSGLGGALVEKGDLDRALEVLNGAVVNNPYPQWTYYQLGRAYEQKNDKDNSIEMYKKAMQKLINKQVLPASLSQCE